MQPCFKGRVRQWRWHSSKWCGSLFVFFLFQGVLLDVGLDRLSSLEDAAGGVWSVRSLWASSLLTARAPRRERPARLRRRLSPCCFSPLAASSAGGLGAASEAAPVRPYPKTSSSEDQGPCSRTSSRQPFVLPASLGRPLRRRRPLPFLVPVGSLVPSPRQDHSFFGRRGPSCGTVSGGVSLRGRVRRRR